MKLYRKKPEQVAAIQLTNENAEEVAAECGGQVIRETNPRDPKDVFLGVNVPTLDGVRRMTQGMFMVMYSNGVVKLVGATAFLEMYEPVE